jgi:hypothetical protein
MALSTFFIESLSRLTYPTIISQDQEETTLVMLEKQPSHKKRQLRGIWSLNKMLQGIIRTAMQYVDGSPIESKGILLKWRNDCSVVAREKYKII